MWEGKVFADADAADTADANWKHKVTPERGDLKNHGMVLTQCDWTFNDKGPILLSWVNFNPNMDK